MKKLLFGLIAIVLFAFNTNAQNVLNESSVGAMHNQQLDVYYDAVYELLKNQKQKPVAKADFYRLYDEQLHSILGKGNEDLHKTANDGFKKNLNLSLEDAIENKVTEIGNAHTISKELKTFLLAMVSEYDRKKDNEKAAFYADKKEEAEKLFKGKELEIALLSINVGKSSFEYWDKNIDKWNQLINDSGVSTTLSKGTVGKADLVGAIAGGIWGGLGGTAVLPGVGTVTGAVAVGLTTAFYMSLVAAVKTLVDFFF